jgi:hypothetical protein
MKKIQWRNKAVDKKLMNQMIRKKNITKLAIILFGIAVFYAVVCTPLYHEVNTNTLLIDSVLPLIVDDVMIVLNYAYYLVAFAFLLYASVWTPKKVSYVPYFTVYVGTTLFRYAANLISGFLCMGFPTAWSAWSDELLYLGIDFLMDLILFIIAFAIVYLRKDRIPGYTKHMPIAKLTDWKNPITQTALYLGMIPAAVHFLSRMIFDIFKGGLPRNGIDLLWMIIGYLSDVLGFVAGFFVILLLLNHLYLRAKAIRLAYEDEKNSIL